MMKELSSYNSERYLSLNDLSPDQQKRASMIDVIWYKDGKIEYVFEVENTTMLTDAVIRASHIPYPIEKFMLLPLDRNRLLHRKLNSPLFSEIFEREGWKVLYYEDLRKLRSDKRLTPLDLAKKAGVKRLESRETKPRRTIKKHQNQALLNLEYKDK